ncbi:hypothetical protein CYLTODRAFT_489436 [Cylindrobasidium torrendii FP15055 ss-10]|uniref:Uncharacterized protein n=1 Tax=Cylindrobasidium torrendii FP15055 ss-10 TaxID=1314674 RepID=A0A0D7BF25_9AGAR|nr:hypothetical protein CYLTODRAFT_489436 [Cylindrobasidium torrendii FP15055 ss-10]
MGSKCSIWFHHVNCQVGHWVGVGEKAPKVLHRIDRLAGVMPGTTNPNNRDNLCMKDGAFHAHWTDANCLVIPVSSTTDLSPPKRLRDITKHNMRCAPRDRINIYDWIPPTDSETSPGQLYLAIFFNWPTKTITLWGYSDSLSFDVPVEDGVLTFMNNHPLLVSFASARNRQRLMKSKKWRTFVGKQTPKIRKAIEKFEQMVADWLSLNIIETRAQFNAGMLPAQIHAPPTTHDAEDTDVPVRRNTRSNAKAVAELQAAAQNRPRMTRSQSTPNLKQKAKAPAPALKRKKSVKTLKKNLKRAAEDEDDGGNAVASTSQAAARPVAKKTRK